MYLHKQFQSTDFCPGSHIFIHVESVSMFKIDKIFFCSSCVIYCMVKYEKEQPMSFVLLHSRLVGNSDIHELAPEWKMQIEPTSLLLTN